MTIQLELWQLITLLLAFFGAVGAVLKIVLAMIGKRFDLMEAARVSATESWEKKFDAITFQSRQAGEQWQRVEREFLKFQADLPVHYVRREDYIRNQTVLEAKLDKLGLTIENHYLKGKAHD